MVNNAGVWPYKVKPGDVLQNSKGTLRVVRKVTTGPSGYPTFVAFSILRCSWTRRPYTVYVYHELKALEFTPIGVRVKLTSKLDKELLKDVQDSNRRELYCWDVVGATQ